MARRNKQAVQKYHDRVARRYDASYEDEFWQFHDALTWDYLKPHLPRDLSQPLLDLGCGTGKWGIKLLQSGYRVTFVDISGPMVERARRKVEELNLDQRAEFVQADLCDLSELPRGAFAGAVAFGDPVGCTSSPAKALKEIRKCLMPGAKCTATLDNKLAALDYYLDRGSPDELRDFLRSGKTHWLTRDEDEQFTIHTYSPLEATKLFEKARFEVVEMRGKTVLNFRHHRPLLADARDRRAWHQLEKTLSRDTDAIARAGHLQIVAQVRDESADPSD